jgi:rfaE bifunctional protein kinase chain/domain/rfaE bifunctional protein nucleotidyltransferase chain/domain
MEPTAEAPDRVIRHHGPHALPSKIQKIGELSQLLPALRQSSAPVVHCHGVFDPLHIGHIRHFQQAKKLGQILVVTVTPDRYVNKGPHRPVFPEQLRAEAIAALECVDFVAINEWPMAIESIKVLRPDIYVKGSEFQSGQDTTGAIALETEAINSVGGKMVFTHDITFSASNLVNRHFPVFPREVSAYLAGYASRFGTQQTLRYLDNIRNMKILVVGETILDEYLYCQAIGKSSKEPTLVVKSLNHEKFAGGILAVANNLASFSRHVSLVSFLGTRDSQESFIREKLHPAIDTHFLYRKDAVTLVKKRFIESYFFMKLFEVYEIHDEPLNDAENSELCRELQDLVAGYDMVVVADFGHNMLTREAVDVLCRESRFLAVNTQSNAGNLGYHTVSKYWRADYISIAENEMRLEARDRVGDLRPHIQDVTRRLGCPKMVVTRGKTGCLCYGNSEGFVEVPAFAGQVVDRVGAGDAFLSITAPCVAQNAPMEVVGFIGNVVGAQAVATVGHRNSIERVHLARHIEHLLK